MVDQRSGATRLTRSLMRLVNKRAHELVGNAYFESCRRYLMERVERELRSQNATLDAAWLATALAVASVEDWKTQALSRL